MLLDRFVKQKWSNRGLTYSLIVKDSQKEFFAARVDPEVLEILKAEAEARGVRVSAIAREAFNEWIARHVRNCCPWCGVVNLPGADWCGSCTAPLSPAAMEEQRRGYAEVAESVKRQEKEVAEQVARIEAKFSEILKLVGPRDLEQGPARPRVRGPGQEPITPEEQT